MPELLEQNSATAPPVQLPVSVLRSRHRWERWRGVLLVLLAGFAVTLAALLILHPSWQPPAHWKLVAAVWAGGLLLTFLAATVAWWFAPASLADTAQGLDRNLAARNRFEAVAELHGSVSPLAVAQREETVAYLEREPRARPVRIFPWLIGGVLLLALAHLIIAIVWVIPALLRPPPPKEPPHAALAPPPPKESPRATIIWKSPEPETKANPVEEVPTVALAESTSGLRDLTLEVSLNGLPQKSTPLPAQPYDQPGKNPIKASIYLDEISAQPFDIVSYFIRGQRITDQKVPDTTSPIQFIQVRPFRDDVTEGRGGTPADNKVLTLLIELKFAELRSIKENFILAHTDLPATDPVRMKENARVGKNQGELSAKTEEVVQAFIQDGVPAGLVDLLRQAEPFMDDASKKILATRNAPALPSQEKALALITETEKFFHKNTSVCLHPDDPFKDNQQFELTRRFETSAGKLEILAKNQARLARDLGNDNASGSSNPSPASPAENSGRQSSPAPANKAPNPNSGSSPPNGPTPGPSAPGPSSPSFQDTAPAPGQDQPDGNSGDKPVPLPSSQAVDPFAPGADQGTFAERQARVLQGIETLLNANTVFPPVVSQALQDARKDATESIQQIDQGDEADAREPADAAAQDLQKAVTEMNKTGEQNTKLAMEQAQQQLNDLAQKVRDLAKGAPGTQQEALADLASQIRNVRQQIEDAAARQQEGGSATGAGQLAHLANQIRQQNIAQDLDGMGKSGLDAKKTLDVAQRLETLAGNAAQGVVGAKPSPQDIALLVNALERDRANLARLAEKASDPGTTPGQQPGNQPGQAQGQGQGQQPGHQPGQDQGQGQGQQPGHQPGQGQGQGQQPGNQPGQGQGQGQGQQPGHQPGQDQGQGQGQGQQPGGQPGSGPGNNPGGSGEAQNTAQTDANAKAYDEILANVHDEVQQASAIDSSLNTASLRQTVSDFQGNGSGQYHTTTPHNIAHAYQAIAPPLDKLISDLHALIARTQRETIIKQPDLDEAPPAYRSAVSDYFEAMSRDYHPDSASDDTKKP